MMDPAVEALSQLNWYPGRPYYEPALIMRAPPATYKGAYSIRDWGLRTTALIAYSAPPQPKHNQAYPIKRLRSPNTGNKQAAAPITGVYTGIPAGGACGGGPYS